MAPETKCRKVVSILYWLQQYFKGNIELKKFTVQEDLGISIVDDLKWEFHINKIVKKANTVLYMVRRCFKNISPKVLLRVYKAYVRPILEHAVVVWCPYFQKDIALLERVQRRATKIPSALKHLTYEERLKALGLTTLEERRDRGCLIEVFKILHKHYTCNIIFFRPNRNQQLRGHLLKMKVQLSHRLSREFFFTNRVIHQ